LNEDAMEIKNKERDERNKYFEEKISNKTNGSRILNKKRDREES